MRDRTQGILILLTFVGIVGLYVGAWLAYQKAQPYLNAYQSSGGGLAGLLNLAKS
jgi:hypothetical protein